MASITRRQWKHNPKEYTEKTIAICQYSLCLLFLLFINSSVLMAFSDSLVCLGLDLPCCWNTVEQVEYAAPSYVFTSILVLEKVTHNYMLLNYIYIRDKCVKLHFSNIIIKYHIMTLVTLNCCTETFPFKIIMDRNSKGVVLVNLQRFRL